LTTDHAASGAETNLKVGSTGPAQKWGRGHRSGDAPENILGRALHLLALKVQSVVLVRTFVMVSSTVWSASFLLFFYRVVQKLTPFALYALISSNIGRF